MTFYQFSQDIIAKFAHDFMSYFQHKILQLKYKLNKHITTKLYLGVAVNGSFKIFVTKCIVPSLPRLQHISHLLSPLLER